MLFIYFIFFTHHDSQLFHFPYHKVFISKAGPLLQYIPLGSEKRSSFTCKPPVSDAQLLLAANMANSLCLVVQRRATAQLVGRDENVRTVDAREDRVYAKQL